MKPIKQYLTVSIWISPQGDYAVRGYYRAVSYQLSRHDSLEDAVAAAFAIPRKQNSVALVPMIGTAHHAMPGAA